MDRFNENRDVTSLIHYMITSKAIRHGKDISIKPSVPICGERIFMNSHGYQCECCSFNFTYYICNRYIDKKEAEIILSGEKNYLRWFFRQTQDMFFSSIPVLDGHSIRLDNTVDYISGIGRIVVGNRSFTNSEQPHKLRIQRIYNGHKLTISEIKNLTQ